MEGTAVLTRDRHMLVAPDEDPEGVIIANMVDALMEEQQQRENDFLEERRVAAASHSKAKADAFAEVLEGIVDRFGYIPTRREP